MGNPLEIKYKCPFGCDEGFTADFAVVVPVKVDKFGRPEMFTEGSQAVSQRILDELAEKGSPSPLYDMVTCRKCGAKVETA